MALRTWKTREGANHLDLRFKLEGGQLEYLRSWQRSLYSHVAAIIKSLKKLLKSSKGESTITINKHSNVGHE